MCCAADRKIVYPRYVIHSTADIIYIHNGKKNIFIIHSIPHLDSHSIRGSQISNYYRHICIPYFISPRQILWINYIIMCCAADRKMVYPRYMNTI